MKFVAVITCLIAISQSYAQTGKTVWTRGGHTTAVENLFFDNSGKLISSSGKMVPDYGYATSMNDRTILTWDVRTKNILNVINGVESFFNSSSGGIHWLRVGIQTLSANNAYCAALYSLQEIRSSSTQSSSVRRQQIVFYDHNTGNTVRNRGWNSTTITMHPKLNIIAVDTIIYDFIEDRQLGIIPEQAIKLNRFSPDGSLLAVATRNDGVSLWNSETLSFVHRFSLPSTPTVLRFSEEGQFLLATDSIGTVFVWNVTGEKIAEFNSNTVIHDAIIVNDTIFTANSDSTLKILDLNAVAIRQLKFPANVTALALHPDKTTMAVGLSDGDIKIVNRQSDSAFGITLFKPTSTAVNISQSGTTIFTKTTEVGFTPQYEVVTRSWLYDTKSGELLKKFTYPHGTEEIVISPDHNVLVINSSFKVGNKDTGELKVVNASDNTLKFKIPHAEAGNKYLTFAFSPDSRLVAVTSNKDTPIQIWNLLTGSIIKSIDRIGLGSRRLAFSPDGQLLVGADDERIDDFNLRYSTAVWRTLDFQKTLTIPVYGTSPIISGDNKYLAMLTQYDSLIVWNLLENKHEYTIPMKGYTTFSFTPNSKYIATFQGKILIWDIAKKEVFTEINDPYFPIEAYAGGFSNDGRYLATGGNVLRLWDLNGITSVENETPVLKTTDLLKVFPNPSNGILTLQLDSFKNISGGEIRIYNSLGVLLKTVPADFLKEMKIDCSELSGGVYFVELSSEKGVISRTSFIIAQ